MRKRNVKGSKNEESFEKTIVQKEPIIARPYPDSILYAEIKVKQTWCQMRKACCAFKSTLC